MPNVVAVKVMAGRRANEYGKVHKPNCFIVTTRWPDLNWKPTSDPADCYFCSGKS